MAYNAEKEVRNTLLDINKNKRGDVIRLSSISVEESDDKSYDIRNMYVREDGELGFTQKGIRLKSSDMVDIVIEVLKDLSTEDYNRVIKAIQDIE